MTAFRLSILALAGMLCGSAALADDLADLNLGGNYVTVLVNETDATTKVVSQTDVGGGPITVSYLNGTQLAWVYCVGFFTYVYVPDDYPETIVSSDGVVNGVAVNNAGQIAWLLDTFAASAAGNMIDEQALQAAIWTVEYDGTGVNQNVDTITGVKGQGYYDQYEADLQALGSNTALLSSIDWFTPGNASGGPYQGLVGPVPEPTSVLLLGTLLFAVTSIKRKKLGVGR